MTPIVDEVELVHATPNCAQSRFPSGRESTVPLRDIALVGEFEPGSPSEQNQQTQKWATKQLEQYVARSTLCLVMVNMSNTLSVVPPYRKASVAAMIAQFYKTAVIERKKASIQTR